MIPLPDVSEIPAIGSPERTMQEREAYDRAAELIHTNDGRLGDALYDLRDDLEGIRVLAHPTVVRDYARAICDHVEQCWATAILR